VTFTHPIHFRVSYILKEYLHALLTLLPFSRKLYLERISSCFIDSTAIFAYAISWKNIFMLYWLYCYFRVSYILKEYLHALLTLLLFSRKLYLERISSFFIHSTMLNNYTIATRGKLICWQEFNPCPRNQLSTSIRNLYVNIHRFSFLCYVFLFCLTSFYVFV
jgi:hypothetical protein